MKVLIVGSKGFIGSHCVDYFSSIAEVWECDVVTDYDNFNYFLVDAVHADYSNCFNEQKYDLCINCSGAASVPDSITNPQRDFALNVTNVFTLLNTIRLYNSSCKYINLSSAAVYGNPLSLPVKEDQQLQPVSPYGHHKRMAESICKEFYELFAISTCSVRIFSAFGPGLKKQLFWDLHKKTKQSNEVILFGSGTETRDFIFISDLVSALLSIYHNAAFNGESINLASGIQTPIRDAVMLFYQIYKYQGKVTFAGKNRPGDPLDWVADITTLTNWGFQPKTSLETGLKTYVKWLEENE